MVCWSYEKSLSFPVDDPRHYIMRSGFFERDRDGRLMSWVDTAHIYEKHQTFNKLVDQITFVPGLWPESQRTIHNLARALMDTTIPACGAKDPVTGLPLLWLGMAFIAMHLENRGIRCRAPDALLTPLAFPSDDVVAQDFTPRVLGALEELWDRVEPSAPTESRSAGRPPRLSVPDRL